MIFVYNLLFPLAFVFFIPGMIIKLIRRPGHKSSYLERFAIYRRDKYRQLQDFRGAIWVHSVSVGETVVALNMIRQWQQREPGCKFVISTTTTTGQELAQRRAPEGCIVIFCPIDFFWFVRKSVKLIQPHLLVVLETEIWPNLLDQVKRHGGYAVLVNGRMSDKSSRGYRRFSMFFAPIFKMFDAICVQTDSDRQRYLAVAPDAKCRLTGNMKFDQQLPAQLPSLDLSLYFGRQYGKVIMAASTHPGEEELIATVFQELKLEYHDIKLILVPRHAERGGEVGRVLNQLGITFVQRSKSAASDEPVDCLLADTTGEMLALIKVADLVIMGKSFAGHHEGHNIIEPAMLGKPIITGALMKNFRFVLNTFTAANAVITVGSDTELKDKLHRLLKEPALLQRYGRAAEQVIQQHRGATEKNIEAITSICRAES